jgi:hypothetical protein
MKINNSNKILKICSIVLVLLSFQFIKSDPSPTTQNPYKSRKDIKHSLFRERDSPDRMSASHSGVPPSIEQE